MDPFLAEIVMFGGNFAPRGWALCDGQLLPINSYQALFSLLGTIYGGDGRTTFALPDMRGRVAIHPGNGPGLSNYNQGPGGGRESVTLGVNNLPSHNHNLNIVEEDATETDPSGHLLGISSATTYDNRAATATMSSSAISNTGGNQSFQIIQPWCAVQFIIATAGIFPSRS